MASAQLHLEHPALEQVLPSFASAHLLGEPWVEPEDVSNAILFLVSDEGRYITGSQIAVDMGYLAK